MHIIKRIITFICTLALLLGVSGLNLTPSIAEDTQEVVVTVDWSDYNNKKNYRPEKFTVTLKTEEKPKKLTGYAVSIYDIGKDIDENGDIMGLTFGPAFGYSLYHTHKSHNPEGVTSTGNLHRCVHEDDWETIIKWNNLDPYVYEECIKEGCSKSVPIDLNAGTTVFNKNYNISTTGDGVTGLYEELSPTTRENLRWLPQAHYVMSSTRGDVYGGWGASRIRAMLNGADSTTYISDSDEGYAISAMSDEHKSASIYTTGNSLLAGFPTELKNAIGKRATRYHSTLAKKKDVDLEITYDKLWLLSPNEITPSFTPTQQRYASVPHEAFNGMYERFKYHTGYQIYIYNKDFRRFDVKSTWSRSIYGISTSTYEAATQIDAATYGGPFVGGFAGDMSAVSPCFSLSRKSNGGSLYNSKHGDKNPLFSVINAEEKNIYSLTLPTNSNKVNYIFNIPTNEIVTQIIPDTNMHYEQDVDLNNMLITMQLPNDEPAQGGEARLKKYLVFNKDAEVPNVRISLNITSGEALEETNSTMQVYAGLEPEKVIVNGYTPAEGQIPKIIFISGSTSKVGPLTGIATADERYAFKNIYLDFSNIIFPEPGVYRYILEEIYTDNPAVGIDENPHRVIDVYVNYDEVEDKLVVDGYVGYIGTVTAPRYLPEFKYEYEDTDLDGTISQSEKDAQEDAYQEAYEAFKANIVDGKGKPNNSYVNAGDPNGVEAGEKSDKYVNKYDSQDLTVSKTVMGNQGSKDQYFKFTITIEDAGDSTVLNLDMSNAETTTHANSATTHSTATMDAANSKDASVDVLFTEEDQEVINGEAQVGDVKIPGKEGQQIITNNAGYVSFDVYLHHGQSIKLNGLPKGATYTVIEEDTAGYETTGEVETPTEIADEDITVSVVNTRGGVIPTGVIIKILPGIGLIAIALFGVLLSRKYKIED